MPEIHIHAYICCLSTNRYIFAKPWTKKYPEKSETNVEHTAGCPMIMVRRLLQNAFSVLLSRVKCQVSIITYSLLQCLNKTNSTGRD